MTKVIVSALVALGLGSLAYAEDMQKAAEQMGAKVEQTVDQGAAKAKVEGKKVAKKIEHKMHGKMGAMKGAAKATTDKAGEAVQKASEETQGH